MIIPASQNDYAAGFADGYRQGKKDAKRKKGHWELIWIKHRDYTSDKRSPMAKLSAYCTECRAIAPELKKRPKGDSKYRAICNVFNFCPNCGVDMRGGEDETAV